jgi:hypothetical protein
MKKMGAIISHVIGGLGNQMFQYAAGRSLSIAHDVQLLLDVRDFAGYRLHQGFELMRVFGCSAAVADSQDVRDVLGWQSSRLVRRVLARPALRFLRHRHLIVEPHFNYWANIAQILPPAYLMGYWQSERYFTDVADIIRRDFTFKQPLSPENQKVAEQIGATNAVSLHVRRGDYLSSAKTLATHGVCSLAYYENAVRCITARVEDANFFVFSDDLDWVRSNLRIDHPCHFVDNNTGIGSYADMRLMSLCKHHIIANSSFSWWGAWLNSYQEKMVVAPRQWFANNNDVKDLFPHDWILL